MIYFGILLLYIRFSLSTEASSAPERVGKCVMAEEVTYQNKAIKYPMGDDNHDPVEECKEQCAGFDYFGFTCAGMMAGMNTGYFCSCMAAAEYDAIPDPPLFDQIIRPMFECRGECKMSSQPQCLQQSADGSRIDAMCPGIAIGGQAYSQWDGYALGAFMRTSYFPMVESTNPPTLAPTITATAIPTTVPTATVTAAVTAAATKAAAAPVAEEAPAAAPPPVADVLRTYILNQQDLGDIEVDYDIDSPVDQYLPENQTLLYDLGEYETRLVVPTDTAAPVGGAAAVAEVGTAPPVAAVPAAGTEAPAAGVETIKGDMLLVTAAPAAGTAAPAARRKLFAPKKYREEVETVDIVSELQSGHYDN